MKTLILLTFPIIWFTSLAIVTSAEEGKQAKKEKPAATAQDTGTIGELFRKITDGKYTVTAMLRVAMPEKSIASASERDRFEIYKNT